MINIKYCKKCRNSFDIATNYDLCPNCRTLPKIITAYEMYNNQLKKQNGRKTKMEDNKTAQPQLGSWDKMPNEEQERKPKVEFEVDEPVEVEFLEDEPLEFSGDKGAYYLFRVLVDEEEKVIMTSAWSLLRALKINTPLKGKKLEIVKKVKDLKHYFEVEVVE